MWSLRHLLRLPLMLCLFSSHSPSPKIFNPVLSTTRWTYPDGLVVGILEGNTSPLPRRDKVEKSGTAISTPISFAILRIMP